MSCVCVCVCVCMCTCVPFTPDLILLGYIAKRGGKRGIEKELDLTSMYKQFNIGDPITLYCEIKSATTYNSKQK